MGPGSASVAPWATAFLENCLYLNSPTGWPPTVDLSSSYLPVTHSRLGMCGAAPWPLQPWVPGPLCPFVSREVDELRPHGAHSETAQPDLAAVLLFSLFSFGLRFE